MKRPILFLLLSIAMSTGAAARDHDSVFRGLMAAVYQNIVSTYECRNVIGTSHCVLARVEAENAIRLSGMPTDSAIAAVDKIIGQVESASSSAERSLNDCIEFTRQTQKHLREWQSKMNALKW